MVSVNESSGRRRRLCATVGAVFALGVVVSGCGLLSFGGGGREMSGTGDEVPSEVLDAYEAIGGRPFPDDVDVLGYEYDFGWLDDRVTVIAETTVERAEELASLERDDQPTESDLPPFVGIGDARIERALERRPVRSFQHSVVGGATETTIMGDDETVTVILTAFEV